MNPNQSILSMTDDSWWLPPLSQEAKDLRHQPLRWKPHVRNLNLTLKKTDKSRLILFTAFLVDLFIGWESMSDDLINCLEAPPFAQSLMEMPTLEGLEDEPALQKALWDYLRRVMDYRNDYELYTYLFEDLMKRLKSALAKKKEKKEEVKRARIRLLKEELMMKTWHPSRFQRWCCDIEEQADFRSVGWDGT